jgi:hypothetical protein
MLHCIEIFWFNLGDCICILYIYHISMLEVTLGVYLDFVR